MPGLSIATLNRTSLPEENDQPNRYLYNGKERQDDNGLGWYDYGARYYDPQVGRWWSMDPMVEKRIWVTPFNYCQNKPVTHIDNNGALDDEWEYNIDTKKIRKIGNLGGKDVQFLKITDNQQRAIRSTNVSGSNIFVDEYEVNNSESIISVSNMPTNAQQIAIINAGELIGTKSPLSDKAKTELLISSMHKATGKAGKIIANVFMLAAPMPEIGVTSKIASGFAIKSYNTLDEVLVRNYIKLGVRGNEIINRINARIISNVSKYIWEKLPMSMKKSFIRRGFTQKISNIYKSKIDLFFDPDIQKREIELLTNIIQ